jgi:arginyl-tRNA--protein-N-Asp/Glu arginylyltransferase
MEPPGNEQAASSVLTLYATGPHPCPYLPDRMAQSEGRFAVRIAPAAYQQLMDLGFRRSGGWVYRPACEGCRECMPLRVPVDDFRPSPSQRRVLRRNRDVLVSSVDSPRCSDEKWRIYTAYLRHRHDGTMCEDRADFEDFLYGAAMDSIEMVYRVDDRIVAVGIVDVCPDCLSSVYFYFDPAESRRSLGTYGALCEIEECRRRSLAYWYAGFYVRDCRRMNYKAQFRPYELLTTDGGWLAAPMTSVERGSL